MNYEREESKKEFSHFGKRVTENEKDGRNVRKRRGGPSFKKMEEGRT